MGFFGSRSPGKPCMTALLSGNMTLMYRKTRERASRRLTMKKYRYLLPVSAALLLAACVGGSGGTSPDFVAGTMAKAHGNDVSRVFVISVPASTSSISAAMQVGMIAGGARSGSVQNILDVLPVSGAKLGISGNSGSVNVATLKRALQEFQGQSNAEVYILASPQELAELQALAAPKGIRVHGLAAP